MGLKGGSRFHEEQSYMGINDDVDHSQEMKIYKYLIQSSKVHAEMKLVILQKVRMGTW